MKVERRIEIAAPPEQVYDVVMDPSRLGDWVTIHERVEDAPEAVLASGATLTQHLKLGGRGFKVRWKVTEDERPRRVRWEGRGPAGSTAVAEYVLTPTAAGTSFDYLNELKTPGGPLGALAGRLVSGMAEREAERSLRRLKALLEK